MLGTQCLVFSITNLACSSCPVVLSLSGVSALCAVDSDTVECCGVCFGTVVFFLGGGFLCKTSLSGNDFTLLLTGAPVKVNPGQTCLSCS